MSGLQAARLGDSVGSHSSAFFGLIAGLAVGLLVGLVLAVVIVGSVLSGGALLAIAGAVLIGLGGMISLGAIGAKIGKKFGSTFKGAGTPCSPIMPPCSIDTKIEDMPAARAEIDMSGPCMISKMPPVPISQGSSTVFVNDKMLVRDTDGAKCGGKVIMHCLNVWVGGPAGGTPGSEVPEWASDKNLDHWAKIGGFIALAGSVLAFGAVATAVMSGVGFVAGKVGKYVGMGAGRFADWMGGRTDKRWEDFLSGTGEVGFGLAAGFGRMGKMQMKLAGGASEYVGGLKGGAFNRQGIVRGMDNPKLRAMTGNLPEVAQNRILSDAARSPSLRDAMLKIEGEGWTVHHDPTYEGAFARRAGGPDGKQIVLGKGDYYSGTGTFAHEVGHAAFEIPPEQFTAGMSREQYVEQNVQNHKTDEGEADFMRLKARDEILENGGRETNDGDVRNQQHYDDYKAGKISRDEAVSRMGEDIFKLQQSGGPAAKSYQDEFADWYGSKYDRQYAATLKPPPPPEPPPPQPPPEEVLPEIEILEVLPEDIVPEGTTSSTGGPKEGATTSTGPAGTTYKYEVQGEGLKVAAAETAPVNVEKAVAGPLEEGPGCTTCGKAEAVPKASAVEEAPFKFKDTESLVAKDFTGVDDPKLIAIQKAAVEANTRTAERVRLALKKAGISDADVDIQFRAKSLKSIHGKLLEKDGQTVGGIKDLSGIRINIKDVNEGGFAQHGKIVKAIRDEFGIADGNVKDYNAKPNDWGYTGRVHMFDKDPSGVYSEIQVGSSELSNFIETKVEMPNGTKIEVHDLTGYKGELYGKAVPEPLQNEYTRLIGEIGKNNGAGKNIGDNPELAGQVGAFQTNVQAWASGTGP
jgi:uncharacterized Zn-binding protein involved in type VI secretion